MMVSRRLFILMASTIVGGLKDLAGHRFPTFNNVSTGKPDASADSRPEKPKGPEVESIDSALPAEATERVFKVPGKDFAPVVRQFVDEFKVHWSHKEDFPIKRLFEILPINVVKDGAADQLIQRGNLHFDANKVSNSGDELEVEFGDQNLGHITIPFSDSLSAELKSLDSGLEINFPQPAIVFFKNLDSKWKVGQNQRLTRITFNPTVVSYSLFQQINKAKIRLDVDLTLEQPTEKTASFGPPLFASLMLPLYLRTSALPQDQFFVGCCCNPHLKGNGPILLKAECIYVDGSNYEAFYLGSYFTKLDGQPDDSYLNKVLHLEAYPFVKCDQYTVAAGRKFVLSADFIVDSITIQTNLVTWPNQSVTIIGGHAAS